MSSVQLLDKTRKIGKLLHNSNSGKVVFNDICKVLCDILSSNMLVISRKGKVLGIGEMPVVDSLGELLVDHVGSFIDPMLNERLLTILSTKENVNLETLGFEISIHKNIRRSLRRLRLQENVWEHCLSTNVMNRMILMILFCVSMEQRL